MLHDQSPLPRALFKQAPEDFVVEEIPAYQPSGAGEHLYVTFKKRLLTTDDAVRLLARALGSDPRQAGWAGQKDKVAVTTQAVTIAVPIKVDPEPLLAKLDDDRIQVLSVARHNGKLKPGHLHGNRFDIVLRGLGEADGAAVAESLGRAAEGVPNAFGPQRFGRDGDSPDRALAWLAGTARPPKDRRDQRMLFSALQSLLFNELLAARVADDTWATVLPGDLAKKHDTGGLFIVPAAGPELDDARERARAKTLSATGPMFGVSMRWPEGEALERERAVLAARGLTPESFRAARAQGEGTRRTLRIVPEDVTVERAADTLRVRFVLPKGAYATTVLARACALEEKRNAEVRPLEGNPTAGPEGADPPEADPVTEA